MESFLFSSEEVLKSFSVCSEISMKINQDDGIARRNKLWELATKTSLRKEKNDVESYLEIIVGEGIEG